MNELRADLQAAIDHYLADCKATGKSPLKAASGKMMLRVSPEVHAKALVAAKVEGKSLNQCAEEVLRKAAKGRCSRRSRYLLRFVRRCV